MTGTELRVQASLWKHRMVRARHDHDRTSPSVVPAGDRRHGRWARDTDLAVLVAEGEAADRNNGGAPAIDALYRVVSARGLALVTDLDRLALRPVPGWRLTVGRADVVTLDWPHEHPLLRDAPLDLPTGWRYAATELRVVLVLAGYGLGLRAHTTGALSSRLERAARTGALVAGAVGVTVGPAISRDGTRTTASTVSSR